jgi:small conductance mechanosensitive channel
MLAPFSNPVNDITDAVQSAQTTGWDFVAALLIMVVAYPLARLARRFSKRAMRKLPKAPKVLVDDVGRLVFWSVMAIAAGLALNALGVGIGWFSVALAAALILMVLMLKPIVESMAAGLLLTMRPNFEIGDLIEVEGLRGTVREVGTRATQLETSDGIRVFIPNQDMLKQTVKVYTSFDHRRATFDVVLARSSHLDAAAKTIREAVAGADGVVADPAPTVQATALQQNGMTFAVEYWYRSSHASDGAATDAAIRATSAAITRAGLDLTSPLVDISDVSGSGAAGEPAPHPVDSTSDPGPDSPDTAE